MTLLTSAPMVFVARSGFPPNTVKELIANYHCEWKKVVENPQLRAKYKHFINDEEPDSTLSFVEIRDQKMPVDWNKNSTK